MPTFKTLTLVAFLLVFVEAAELTARQQSAEKSGVAEGTRQKQTEAEAQTIDLKDSSLWQVLSPENSGFEIRLPGESKHTQRTVKPHPEVVMEVDLYWLSVHGGRTAFVVGVYDVQEMPETDEKRKEILDGGIKGTMINVMGQMTSHESVEIEGYPARTFSYTGVNGDRDIKGLSHLVLVGQRVYQMSIIQFATEELDEAVKEQFFGSFKLLETK